VGAWSGVLSALTTSTGIGLRHILRPFPPNLHSVVDAHLVSLSFFMRPFTRCSRWRGGRASRFRRADGLRALPVLSRGYYLAQELEAVVYTAA